MARKNMCSICNGPVKTKELINAGLSVGISMRKLAAQYDLHPSTIGRHKKNCLSAGRNSTEPDIGDLVSDATIKAKLIAEEKKQEKSVDDIFSERFGVEEEVEFDPFGDLKDIVLEVKAKALMENDSRLILACVKQMESILVSQVRAQEELARIQEHKSKSGNAEMARAAQIVWNVCGHYGIQDVMWEALESLEFDPDTAPKPSRKRKRMKHKRELVPADVQLKHPEYGPGRFSADKTHSQTLKSIE